VESLPDVDIPDLETTLDVWRLWRATDRRFLPSQLRAEPALLLRNVLMIDAMYRRLDDDQGQDLDVE
jgi:hypothetical protein